MDEQRGKIAYTYSDITYNLPIKLNTITQLEIVQIINDHAKIVIKGIGADTLTPQDVEGVKERSQIEINLPERRTPYFAGVCTSIEMWEEAGLKIIIIQGLSWTYELDIQKKSRSYQKLNRSYEEFVGDVLTAYPAKGFINALPANKKYTKFAIQYRETDWEFLKRIAAREGTVLIPEYADSAHRPRFWLGLPEFVSQTLPVLADRSVGCDHGQYQQVAANQDDSLTEQDFTTYQTTSYEVLPLGQKVKYADKELSIIRVISTIRQGLLTSTYTLAFSEKMALVHPENSQLMGLSLPGKILGSRGVNSKIHLGIDEQQEATTALWFPYASDSGNVLYCMPHNGETCNLYFKDGYEENAIVVNGSRKNGGGCPKTGDYNNRYFTTHERKEMFLSPDTVSFTVDEGAAEKIAIVMNEEKGISIESTKDIALGATLGIHMEAEKNVSLEAIQGLYAYCGTSSIIITDNNVNFYGTEVVVEGMKKVACPSVEQPPEEKEESLFDKFKKMPLIDKIQLGLDIASCLPFIGSAAAVINGGISLARGNYGEAALNFACAIPGAAWAKVGAKAVKLGKVAVTAVKAEKAVNKALKVAKFTGEILGKGKTLALKAIEKIPKIRVQEVYMAGLRTAEGIEVGGFKYYRLAVEAGEKGTGKVAKRASKAKRVPIPGDADFTGKIPSGSWKLSPRGQGAHMIERANVKGRSDLAKFDQKTTPRFYPNGSPENAGQAHIRIHQATKKAGIGLQGGNPTMTDAQLIDAYKKAYSNPRLEGILGDLRTPDGKVVLGQNLTPSQALDKLLEWGKI